MADEVRADVPMHGGVMDYADMQPMRTLSKPYVKFCETDEHDRV